MQIQHLFQFSLNPVHELIRFDQRHVIAHEDDAFTFTWKAVLRRVCKHGWLEEACFLPTNNETSAGNLRLRLRLKSKRGSDPAI